MKKHALIHDLERVAREKVRSRSLLTASLSIAFVWFIVWVLPLAHPQMLGPLVARAEFILETVLLVLFLALSCGYLAHSGNPVFSIKKKQFSILGLREVQQSDPDPDPPQKEGKGKEKPPTVAPLLERNYGYSSSSSTTTSSSPRSPTNRRGVGGGIVNRHSNSHEKNQFAFSELARTTSGSSPMYDSSYASSSMQTSFYVNNTQTSWSYQNSPKESEHSHHMLTGGRKLKIYDAIKYLGLEKAQESGYLSSWVESLRRVLIKHAQDTLQDLEASSRKVVLELSKKISQQQPHVAFTNEEKKSVQALLLCKGGAAQINGREYQLVDIFKLLRQLFGGDPKVYPGDKEVLEEVENCASLLELFCPLGTVGNKRLASVNLDIAMALRSLPDLTSRGFPFSALTGSSDRAKGGTRRHANYTQDELYLVHNRPHTHTHTHTHTRAFVHSFSRSFKHLLSPNSTISFSTQKTQNCIM